MISGMLGQLEQYFMIKAVKASLSEKILFIFLICLGIFAFTSFFLLKNKCLSVKEVNLEKVNI